MKNKSYTVGYGRPPRHSRFKKGQSGNPKGRPKGARGLEAELDDELKLTVKIKENGRQRKISNWRAMLKGQVRKAVLGDTKAFQTVVNYREAFRGKAGIEEGDLAPIDKLILDDFVRRRNEGAEDGTTN